MKKFAIGLVAAAVLAMPIAVNGLSADASPTNTASASWAFKPATLDQVSDKSSDVIVGKVVSVESGQDIVQNIQGEPAPTHIPTTIVTVESTKSIKGAPVGTQYKVFTTGNNADFVLEGSPAFNAGEEYVLFLEKRGVNNEYLVVSPEGRYAVENGKIAPVAHDGFAADLKGKALGELINSVKTN